MLSASKAFSAGLRDEDDVLELRRESSICSRDGPIIRPRQVSPMTMINHWLNGEDVAGLHDSNGLVVAIVRNVRRSVEQTTDAVTYEALDDGKAFLVRMLRNHVSKLSVHLPGATHSNGFLQAFVRRLNELLVDLLGRS